MVSVRSTKSMLKLSGSCTPQNYLYIVLIRCYSKKFGKRKPPDNGKSANCENASDIPTSKIAPQSVGATRHSVSRDQKTGKKSSERNDGQSNRNFNLQDLFAIRNHMQPVPKLMDRHALKSVAAVRQQAKFCTKMSGSSKKRSLGRHQFHEDCECALNQQIFAELNAALAYLSMACYFGRTDVALPGCQGFFLKMHEEEMGHAKQFIDYQLIRGGRIYWFPISIPDCEEFDSAIKAFGVSTEMEKLIKEKIQCVHDTAEKHRDLQMQDVMVNFLDEQNKSICEMARLQLRAIKLCEDTVGEFLFDKELFEGWVKKSDKNAVYK